MNYDGFMMKQELLTLPGYYILYFTDHFIVLYHLVIVLYIILLLAATDHWPFGIFKLSLN